MVVTFMAFCAIERNVYFRQFCIFSTSCKTRTTRLPSQLCALRVYPSSLPSSQGMNTFSKGGAGFSSLGTSYAHEKYVYMLLLVSVLQVKFKDFFQAKLPVIEVKPLTISKVRGVHCDVTH